MTFLHPWLLACAPLALLPVAFHLFFRLRKRSQRFSSLMFFLKVDPHAQARHRLREILLLALRVLLLLAAILALARPQLTGIGGGGPGALALLIDTSASMGGTLADGRPKLALAREAAAALIDGLGAGDTAAILPTVTDPALTVPAGLVTDRAALRAAVDKLAPTEASGDVPRTLARAAALLSESTTARREIHVLTDAQAGEWSQPGTLPAGIRVVVHRIDAPARTAPDVAIRAVQPPLHRALVGRPARSAVVLVNHGTTEAAIDLRISEADGQERLLHATVPANGETAVGVAITPTAPGACTATVRVEGDAFPGGNGGGIAIWAHPKLSALLVGDTGLLATALSPERNGSRSGLVPTPLAWKDLARALAAKPAVLVATWSDLPAEAAEPVRAWVAAGGRLLVLPSPQGDGVGGWPWLCIAPGALQSDAVGIPLVQLAPSAQVWNDLRGDRVSEVRARRWRPLKGEGTAAYGLADGTPLLIERTVGKGLVVACGLAFHPAWSDLPVKGWSLALMHAIALPAADDSQVIRLVAGQPFAPSTADGRVTLRTAAGAILWSGPRRELPAVPRAGAYLLDGTPVAVSAAAAEGVERYVTDARLPALGDGPQTVQVVTTAAAVAQTWNESHTGTDLTPWLALLALLALAVEGWIATESSVPVKKRAPIASTANMPAVLVWMPQGPSLVIALAVVAVVVVLVLHHRRLRRRLPPREALLHLLPRAGVALLLLALLLGPTLRFDRTAGIRGTVVALVDTSSSMDVTDDGKQPRLTRATGLIDRLKKALPGSVEVRTLGFDTRVRDGDLAVKPGARPGDPAAVLRGLGAEPAAKGALAVVALTDGGDEPFTVSAAPPSPLSIIGIGTDPGGWRNLAVTEVQAPATAEVRLETTITATIGNQTPATQVPVRLERRNGDAWEQVAEAVADVRAGRAQVVFRRTHDTAGLVRYRIAVSPVAEEVALSDNQREFVIDVRAQTLHVLFFSREVGADYKSLRQELARDPGLTFTGLLRTTVSKTTGERYLLQGDRLDGDTALEGGLPTEAKSLARYGVVILGAFPATAWRAGEQEALAAWVGTGGTLILLGGDEAFPAGALSGLYPFSGNDGLARGSFPISVPPQAMHHPAMAGVTLPPDATVDSRNRFGAPSPAATVLLAASDGGRSVPLVLSQPVGQGTVVAVGTNTLWRLARPGQDSAYGTFWRQLVRQQVAGDRERRVRIAWDRERYRPGDTAVATVTALEPGLTLAAALQQGDGKPVPVALDAQGHARLDLLERGDWTFALSDNGAELYRKVLPVAPGVGEGERLAVDDAVLRAAAEAGGGSYGREADADRVFQALAEKLAGHAERVERGLLDGWWTALLIAGLMACEWILRRRRNWL